MRVSEDNSKWAMRDANGVAQPPSIQGQNPDHEKAGAPNRAPIESVMSILQFLADHLTNIGKHGNVDGYW